MNRGVWWATDQGHKESDTTGQLTPTEHAIFLLRSPATRFLSDFTQC